MVHVNVRRATTADEAWWLSVRNDEVTRQCSFRTEKIDPDTHHRWFAGVLASSTERLYILEADGIPVGQLRLSLCVGENGDVEISYAVAPEARGKGVGHRILGEAKRLAGEEFPGRVLFGEVKPDNTVSCHLFETAGFVRREPDRADAVVYTCRAE